ncbi:hypothetical protein [Kitasatospora sp. NPDC092286]|uniref:hypothetical protein n=1 Tax=Kitasatospora sp. NPDC092286 TaxID=3364087 RepID=UPI00380D5273
MYAPLVRRQVVLVVLDEVGRVALIPASRYEGGMRVPVVTVRRTESWVAAAAKGMVELGVRSFRWGNTVGHRWAYIPRGTGQVRVAERIYLARASSAGGRIHGRCRPMVCWSDTELLSSSTVVVPSPELATLVAGYIEGWIPDGLVGLD